MMRLSSTRTRRELDDATDAEAVAPDVETGVLRAAGAAGIGTATCSKLGGGADGERREGGATAGASSQDSI